MTIESITIDPPMSEWPALIKQQPHAEVFGRTLNEWRLIVRDEYNLIEDRPVIATGHQPTLWHPGILAKYVAAQAFGRGGIANVLNVTVSQDVMNPAVVEAPVRLADGALIVRTIDFAAQPNELHRTDRPIVAQPAFAVRPFDSANDDLLPSVRDGLERIHVALSDGAQQPNAAAQMMVALSRLMTGCAGLSMMDSSMSSSMGGQFGVAMLRAMAADPHRCGACYNAAVAAVPEARLTPLAIREDMVELPIWRWHEDGRRLRAYDSDVEAALEEYGTPLPQRRMRLMPRALMMTAMLRMTVCDIFIHGMGGAIYDRAMERWIRDWLGVEVAPAAVVTADVRLPLMDEYDVQRVRSGGLDMARRHARRLEHDPEFADAEQGGAHHPGANKRAMLAGIDSLPPRSVQRRAAFFEMHRRLEEMRRGRVGRIDAAHREEERMQRLACETRIALRRDWAFPLYPAKLLTELAGRIRSVV